MPVTSSAPIDLQTIVAASPQHVACELGDEMVILSVETGEYYGLNPVSASVWSLLQQPTTARAVRDALLEEYEGITAQECEAQVLALLGEMRDLQLVEVREPQR